MRQIANPEIVLKLRNEGKSCREIGTILGCQANNINKILRQNFGIKAINPYRHNKRSSINSLFFDNPTEYSCYVLGFLYADGCVSKSSNRIILKLAISDIDILQEIKDIIKSSKLIKIYKTKRNNCQDLCELSICDSHIKEKLIDIGCTPQKTFTLKWPKDYLTSNNIHHFVRGYLDGDGCIYVKNIKKSSISFVGSVSFIASLKENLEKYLDINCSVYKCKNPLINQLFIYGAKQSERFGDWLYRDATIYLKRKYNNYIIIKNRPNKRIKNG